MFGQNLKQKPSAFRSWKMDQIEVLEPSTRKTTSIKTVPLKATSRGYTYCTDCH